MNTDASVGETGDDEPMNDCAQSWRQKPITTAHADLRPSEIALARAATGGPPTGVRSPPECVVGPAA
jgi:hypothetical protein